MNLTSFGHASYYYFLLQKVFHLVGEKKKKGKKRLMQLLQRNFLEKMAQSH
jgi:hypothetical protein